jgi:hypothetical protein
MSYDQDLDEQRRVHGGLNDMVYSRCQVCGKLERHGKGVCIAQMRKAANRVEELEAENATLKDELNRLAIVHGAGVGIINSRGYKPAKAKLNELGTP